jgi:hypothetical protein
MNDPWLYGMSLRKNRSKALPTKGEKELLFNGTNQRIDIINSNNVGSIFDFGNTNPFTLAGKIITQSTASQLIFDKRNSFAPFVGYYIELTIKNSRLALWLVFRQSDGSSFALETTTLNIMLNMPYFFVIGYNGSGGIFLDVYDSRGLLLPSGGAGSGALNGAASINNVGKLVIGANYNSVLPFKGYIGTPCVFNIALNPTQRAELALAMINNAVGGHSLYNSNCVAHWENFPYSGEVLNRKNSNYNGLLINF